MNCANHSDQSAVAYCRTCGKALCANCTRPVRGVIYCEDCLGVRMEGIRTSTGIPTAGFVSGAAAGAIPPPVPIPAPPMASASGPNPTVAGILAGFFPFGVGAVYTGQYAKGLAHLAVFALFIAGCNAASNSSHGDMLGVICGLGLAFFWVYQIVDAVRSARAIQVGLPAPDPYGLAATFGTGQKMEAKNVPIGAIVLILLGVLFLMSTMGFELGLDRFWPLILIAVGGWLFVRNFGLAGAACKGCQCARCRSRRLMGPAVVSTLGVLLLLETTGRVDFSRTWPILLLVIGGVKLFQNSASSEGHIALPPSNPPVSPADVPPPPAAPASSSEVNRG